METCFVPLTIGSSFGGMFSSPTPSMRYRTRVVFLWLNIYAATLYSWVQLHRSLRAQPANQDRGDMNEKYEHPLVGISPELFHRPRFSMFLYLSMWFVKKTELTSFMCYNVLVVFSYLDWFAVIQVHSGRLFPCLSGIGQILYYYFKLLSIANNSAMLTTWLQ